MKATRESDSKETASDEKDLSLKHFPVFIFAAYSSFSLSPLSLWICFLFFQVIPSYFWHKVINSVNENESSQLLQQCSAGNFSSSRADKSCSHNYQAATWECSRQKQNHCCPVPKWKNPNPNCPPFSPDILEIVLKRVCTLCTLIVSSV